MLRAVALVLLLVSAAPALAEQQCRQQGDAHVCWDGFTGTEVSEDTPAGEVRVETYTDRREGGDDVDYLVTRDGVRASVADDEVDVQRVQYEGSSEDATRPGETRTVHFDEVRFDGAGRHGSVGLRRTSYTSRDTTLEVCHVYAFDGSVEAPCSPVFP